MILQALHHDAAEIIAQVYGDDLPLPPPMYTYQPLGYVIEIDPSTDRTTLQAMPQGDRKKGERPRTDSLPYLGRTSAVVPILLVDKAAYVLGVKDGKAAAEGKFEKRDQETRQAFHGLVRACREATGLTAELDPVLRFLERWSPDAPEFAIPAELKSNDLIGFRVRGVAIPDSPLNLVSDHPAIRNFWSEHTRGRETRRLNCLVTAAEAEVETKLPLGIKGVPGGQSSGAALSSFNENAFMSYGLREFSAPISRDAGERFGKALNALLSSERHRTVIGPFDSGVVYAYWSPGTVPVLPALADAPDAEQVEDLGIFADDYDAGRPANPAVVARLFSAPHKGREVMEGHPEEAEFHILGLSSHSGGRVAIRSALSLTVAELYRKQRDWFRRLRIVDPRGQVGRPLGIPSLIRSAYRDRKEMPNHLYDALVQMAFAGAPPPESLLPTVVRRCQIGSEAPGTDRREHVTYARAMLLKLLLTWTNEEKARLMSDIDPKNDEAAYRLGRLLYHLERIQYLAQGRVNATLVDRYYGGASTTPQAVFPHLLRLANQAHLPAIRREKGGFRFQALQDELAEITAPIGMAFPRYLGLKEQGSFALGYYFQRAKIARELAELKARGEKPDEEEPETPDGNDNEQ